MEQADAPRGEQGLATEASARVQDAASVAQEKASELRDQGSARLRDQFDQRSDEAASQLRSFADALRRSGNELGAEQDGRAAQLTEQAADRIERVGSYLQQKSGDDFMRDLDTFARRRPWMLAGLGALIGVAAARFVKASSERRYGDDGGRAAGQWPTTRGFQDSRASLEYGTSPGAITARSVGDDARGRGPYVEAR